MSLISDAIKESKEIHFLVDLNFNGLRKKYSDKQLNIARSSSSSPAYRFDGRIINIGSISNRFDINNFKYTLQNVSITIANPFNETKGIRLQDSETLRKLDGGKGNIYLWSPGLTWEDIETNGLLYSGVFQKQYHNSDVYVFDLVDAFESRFSNIPNKFISDETFSNFNDTKTSASGGKEQQIIFGDWPKGVKLECVDTESFKYLMSSGHIKIAEGLFYPSATEILYAASGVSYEFTVSGVSTYHGYDETGNAYTYVQFPTDQSASEPLSCSMEGLLSSGTTIIEHPADIAEYIVGNYSNLTSSEVDYGSFAQFKNIVPGVQYTSCFNSVVNSVSAIDRILNKLLAARINKVGGRVGIVTLDLKGAVKKQYTKQKHCVSNDITISKTPYNLICNNLTIQYAVNVATSSYERSVHADSGNNRICKQSELDYGKQPEVVLTIPDIWDTGSINILLERYLSFYAYRHDVLEWEVSYEDGFDIVEGDVVSVTVPEGSSTVGQGWIDQKCILLQKELKNYTIKQMLWCISTAPGTKMIERDSASENIILLGGEPMTIGGVTVTL